MSEQGRLAQANAWMAALGAECAECVECGHRLTERGRVSCERCGERDRATAARTQRGTTGVIRERREGES